MKLQVALDMTSYSEAIAVAKIVEPFVDIIEVGTPLIKAEGMRTVRQLRHLFPEKTIVADTKTADVAFLEADLARKAGATYFTVLATAPRSTLKEALRARKELGIKVAVDFIGVADKIAMIKELKGRGFDAFILHTAIDEGKFTCKELDNLKKKPSEEIIVSGGITAGEIPKLDVTKVDTVIAGRAITGMQDPAEAAKILMKLVE
ncbi:MAG: 3-hexulose-6-phosphate synthase [Candidatus Altiarchaeota archaeon]|nr:3-hexulose-6-phosphate synthase [Candidatus Altiarchaeota archaeon]